MPALAGDLATLKQMTSLAALGIQAATPGCGLGDAVVEFTRESEKTTWKRGRKKGNKKIDRKDKKKRGVKETMQR